MLVRRVFEGKKSFLFLVFLRYLHEFLEYLTRLEGMEWYVMETAYNGLYT